MGQTTKGRRLGVGTIDDLIDGVDRFPFARAAAKNENAGDEVEVIIVSVMALVFVVLVQDDFGDTNGLATMPAMHTAEMLRRQFS